VKLKPPATHTKTGNHIVPFFIFEELYELNDVRMTLAMMKSLHFLKHSATTVAWNFVNNFHSVLQVCPDINTGLDRCICPFSKHLTSQLIQL
jgi:hypothetical protein